MIIKKFLEENDTYRQPVEIEPKWLIVHSTGVGYKSKDDLFHRQNKWGELSEHGIVDDEGSYHTLPLNYLAWHVGKKGNDKTIGFEICEPKNIAYADKNHTKIDTSKYNPNDVDVKFDFEKRYANAVELAVYFCRQTGMTEKNILSHKEACAKGIASNHADVEHWFPLFNRSMDGFRADVKRLLSQKPNPNTGGEDKQSYVYRIFNSNEKQLGAYKNIDNVLNVAKTELLNGKDIKITAKTK